MKNNNKDDTFKTVVHISFGIKGDHFNPSDITDSLGLDPSRSWKKGDKYQSRYRNKDGTFGMREAFRPWSIWELSSEKNVDSDLIELHSKYLLKQLKLKKSLISDLLKDTSLRVFISVWWEPEGGQGGFTLPSIFLNELSCFCNEIDFYFC